MNQRRLDIWRWGTRIFLGAVAIAVALSLMVSCSTMNSLFNAKPESEQQIQRGQEEKRIPLPPLTEDFQ